MTIVATLIAHVRHHRRVISGSSPTEQLDRLLRAELDGMLPPLLSFWGHTARAKHPGLWVLSQWWMAKFEVAGTSYLHAEGYMMAEKARLFGDKETRAKILGAAHPAEAKNLGRHVSGFDEDRWRSQRYAIVVRGNLAKFGQHDDLRRYLRSTSPRVLVEASPMDLVWGIGLAERDDRGSRPSDWRGMNLLGFALGEVRERLAAAEQ
jgi:ribA/ribD-fused uncharacterized protein